MSKIMFSTDKCHFSVKVVKVVLRGKTNKMSVVIILIISSLVVAGGFLVAFLWSVKKGQFDDIKTPAMRILFEDKPPKTQETKKDSSKTQ
jgi:cbb3-type cytochrome oxidase maturation protein